MLATGAVCRALVGLILLAAFTAVSWVASAGKGSSISYCYFQVGEEYSSFSFVNMVNQMRAWGKNS